MLPNGYGKVISVVLSPRRGIPGMFHSSAARAAVESMTRTLATEWGGRGVRLTCVAPGTIDTEGWRGYGDTVESVAATIPLRRLGTAERGRADDRLPGLARRRLRHRHDGRDRRRRRQRRPAAGPRVVTPAARLGRARRRAARGAGRGRRAARARTSWRGARASTRAPSRACSRRCSRPGSSSASPAASAGSSGSGSCTSATPRSRASTCATSPGRCSSNSCARRARRPRSRCRRRARA